MVQGMKRINSPDNKDLLIEALRSEIEKLKKSQETESITHHDTKMVLATGMKWNKDILQQLEEQEEVIQRLRRELLQKNSEVNETTDEWQRGMKITEENLHVMERTIHEKDDIIAKYEAELEEKDLLIYDLRTIAKMQDSVLKQKSDEIRRKEEAMESMEMSWQAQLEKAEIDCKINNDRIDELEVEVKKKDLTVRKLELELRRTKARGVQVDVLKRIDDLRKVKTISLNEKVKQLHHQQYGQIYERKNEDSKSQELMRKESMTLVK